MQILAALVVIGLCIGIFNAVVEKGGASLLIALLVGGGIGFAIGNRVNEGWAIFGAILGALIGYKVCTSRQVD